MGKEFGNGPGNGEEGQLDNQYLANRVLQEIAECREDERSTQERLLQLISIAATVLGVLLTATFWAENSNDDISKVIRDHTLELSFLSDFLFIAAVSLITYLGIGNFIRHHYLKSLENKYEKYTGSKQIFIDWVRVSSPIKTVNVKHLKHPFSFLSFFAYIGGAFLALLFCFVITIVIYNRVGDAEKGIATWGMAFVFLFLMADFVLLLVGATQAESVFKNFENKAIRKAEVELLEENGGKEGADMDGEDKAKRVANYKKELKRGILYFIYPKVQDLQKLVLIPFGYACGLLLSSDNWDSLVSNLHSSFGFVLISIIIIELFLYAARYHLNDVRGVRGDNEESDRREENNEARWGVPRLSEFKGLITDPTPSEKQIQRYRKKDLLRALIFAGLKFVIAITAIVVISITHNTFLTGTIDNEKIISLSVIMGLILISTLLYERGRARNWKKRLIWLVGSGYALRFAAGVLVVYQLSIADGKVITVIGLFLAMYIYGIMSVALACTLRASKENSNRDAPQEHPEYYTKSYNMFLDSYSMYHPLTKIKSDADGKGKDDFIIEKEQEFSRNKYKAIWNICLLIESVIILVLFKLSGANLLEMFLLVCFLLAVAGLIGLRADRASASYVIVFILLVAFTIAEFVLEKNLLTTILSVYAVSVGTYIILCFFYVKISLEEILGLFAGNETIDWAGYRLYKVHENQLAIGMYLSPSYVIDKKVGKMFRVFKNMEFSCRPIKKKMNTFAVIGDREVASFVLDSAKYANICRMEINADVDKCTLEKLETVFKKNSYENSDGTYTMSLNQIWNSLCELNGRAFLQSEIVLKKLYEGEKVKRMYCEMSDGAWKNNENFYKYRKIKIDESKTFKAVFLSNNSKVEYDFKEKRLRVGKDGPSPDDRQAIVVEWE